MKSFAATYGRALLIAVLAAVATTHAGAAEEGTSAETKARMIQIIDKLESDPYVANGREIRDEVLTWIAEAPDVTVSICPSVLGDFKKIKGEDGATLVVQLMFSEAKFILEHPDKSTDQRAINIAGVEGVLRTYAAMKTVKPKLAIREIDQLVKLQGAGQLGQAVDAGLAKCSS